MAKLPSGDDLRKVFYENAGMTMDELEDELTIEELASGIAALIASISLSIFSLSSESTTEAEQTIEFAKNVAASSKAGLRMTMTIVPVILLFVGLFWFRRKYRLTDPEMERITAEVHKKRNA